MFLPPVKTTEFKKERVLTKLLPRLGTCPWNYHLSRLQKSAVWLWKEKEKNVTVIAKRRVMM